MLVMQIGQFSTAQQLMGLRLRCPIQVYSFNAQQGSFFDAGMYLPSEKDKQRHLGTWAIPTGGEILPSQIIPNIKYGYDETKMGFVVHDLHRMIPRYCIQLYAVCQIFSLYFEVAIETIYDYLRYHRCSMMQLSFELSSGGESHVSVPNFDPYPMRPRWNLVFDTELWYQPSRSNERG